MHLDPRDPAAQAFVADHLSDFPLDSWDEACDQSDALQCDACGEWFSSPHDLDDGLCNICDAEENYSPIKRAWVR